MLKLLIDPWPWYVGGPIIGLIMLLLIFLNREFGFSSNFRTICSAFGAGNVSSFFKIPWKRQSWNLFFLLGAVLGGYLASHYLSQHQVPKISSATVKELHFMGIASAGKEYYPTEIFDHFSPRNLLMWAVGGLLIGFGSRYAGGCTSGHAISGLSNFQLPSLIAVIGFFIGGLLTVHLLFPIIF